MVEIPKNQDIDYEKWLTIAKHNGANEWAKYIDIQEFWNPVMNTKTSSLHGLTFKNPIVH